MPVVNIPNVGDVTFPDTMSQDEINNAIETDILHKPTPQNVAPKHVADPDDSSAFIRGIKAYAPQTKELWNAAKVITGAGIQKLAGEGDFSHDMIANGLKGMEEAKAEQEPLQAKVAWNDSVNGFITEYLPYMMGQGVANAGEGLLSVGVGAGLGAFFGGGVGAIPGGMAGLVEKKLITQGVKELAEKIAEKEGAEAAAKFVANRAKQVVTSKGGMLGMATQAAFHGIGEPGSRAIEEIQKKNPDADVAKELNFTKLAPAMAIHTAADFLAEKVGLGELKGLDAAGKNLLTDIAKVYITSTAKEIPAELAQQFAERFGADLNIADLDAMKEYAETIVGTFAQGIPMAGIGGVKGYVENHRIRNQIAEIVKPDLVARTGKEPTPQELTTFVDKVIATRNKMQEEKNATGNTGDNTGITQPGVSTSEGAPPQRGTESGPETNAQSNVVGNEQPAVTTGNGTESNNAELKTEQVNALQPGETNGDEATQTQQTETQKQETTATPTVSNYEANYEANRAAPIRVALGQHGEYSLQKKNGEPASDLTFKTEEEARAAAAKLYPKKNIAPDIYAYNENDFVLDKDKAISEAAYEKQKLEARNVGIVNARIAFDQKDSGDYESLEHAIDSYQQNVGDTLIDQGLNKDPNWDYIFKAADNAFKKEVERLKAEQTKETPSENEQAALQDELDQELGQNQEPTDEEIVDRLLEQSQIEEEQRRQDEENKEDLGEPTPEQVETEQEARNVEAMTDREEKLRHISQTPKLGALPADLQSNPIVQQYHDLFNQYVHADEDGAIERKTELSKQLQVLKPQLPSSHPARVAMGKTEQQLKKGLDKKEKKNKSNSPKVQNADLNTLEATVHPVVDDAIRSNDFQGALKSIVRYGGDYFSKLAQRLLNLNFTVNIGYNLTNKVLENFLTHTAPQRNKVEAYLQINYHHIWDRYFNEANFDPSINPILLKAEAYSRLIDGRIKIPNKSLEPYIRAAYKSLDEAVGSLAAAGFYYDGSIAFNNALNGGVTTNYVLMHESVHAAVSDLMLHPEKLTPEQRKAYYNLVALYHNTVKQLKGTPYDTQYGLLNIHEFIAEAFSSKEFQKILRGLYVENKTDQSTWSKFIQYVAKLIGVDNVLFQTMANTDVLFSAKENSITSGINTFNPSTAIPQNSLSLDNTSKFAEENTPKISKNIAAKKDKFRVNTSERTGMFGTIGDLIRSHSPWSKVNKRKFVSNLSSVGEEYRQALLGALTLDQLSDLVGDKIPQFKSYVKEVDAMIYTRNKILAEGDIAIKLWSQLIQSNPKKAEELHEVMLNATVDQIEADTKGDAYDAANWPNVDQGIKNAWNKMVDGTEDGKIALKIYREVREFYKQRMNEYIAIQKERTLTRLKAEGATEEEIKKALVDLQNNITKDALKVYFPLKRFGEFWLQTDKGKGKTFQQFETAGARDNAYEEELQRLINIEKNRPNYSKKTDEEIRDEIEKDGSKLQAGNNLSEIITNNLSDWSHLQSLKDLVDKSTNDIMGSTNAKVIADPISALSDQVKDQLSQMYLELMPNESIRKMFLHRDNISGASIDMLRAFEVSRLRMAYQRSRFEHLPELFKSVREAQQQLKYMPPREGLKYRDYVHELTLNLQAILNPPKQSGIVTALNQFGFINFLTAPASFMINLLGVGGVWAPAANARYGIKNTTIALAKFNRLLGGTGFTNESTGRYEFLSLARANMQDMEVKDKNGKPIGKTYADVYQDGVRRGTIDVTLSHEAAQIGEKPSNQYTGRWNKVMYYVSLPFHASEKYMRETTFMATFDLAYNKALTEKTYDGKPRYTPEKAYEAAIQEADALVKKTLFNYNTINKPRYFRGNWRNILLQFKMYPQQLTVLMFRTFQKALGDGMQAELIAYEREIKKVPKEEQAKLIEFKKQELAGIKREARDQFLGMMGMAFLTSGITGLPFWFLFSSIASAFNAAFGDSDEPFDVDNWFKNWCYNNLGNTTGEIFSRGALSTASGINFADRMSTNLPDLWFQDVRKGKDELTQLQNTMVSLLGPSVGALVTYAEALDRFNQGHVERAIETAMPSAIKNVMAGTRYLVEGKALTMKGDTLIEEVPARYALSQMLGFTPDAISKAQKANIEMKNASEEIISRHNDLLNAFFIALDSGDTSMMDRVIAKIVHFSQTNPGKAIMPDDLFDSVKQRYENRALANITGGMGIDKKLIPQLQGWRDYANKE